MYTHKAVVTNINKHFEIQTNTVANKCSQIQTSRNTVYRFLNLWL